MSMPAFEESSRLRRPARAERKVFDLPTACTMLPLVRRIVSDIVGEHSRFAHLQLQAKRHAEQTSSWEAKKALYRLHDEISASRAALRSVQEELTDLGAVLLDPVHGTAGFPTIVNGSLAYLVYQASLDDIRHWRYRDQPKLRPIPESWYSEVPLMSEQEEGLLI